MATSRSLEMQKNFSSNLFKFPSKKKEHIVDKNFMKQTY